MGELGEFLGFLIIVSYGFAVLNFFLKFGNRKFKDKLKKSETFYGWYMRALKFFAKYHLYFGLATILFILSHFFIQFLNKGISITGVVAAGLMVCQILLGIYGQIKRPKAKGWLYLHRGIAVILFVSILIHII